LPVINKSVSTEDYIFELILPTDGMTVDELVRSTGYSKSLVRQKLDILTARTELLIDKKRQPYVYTVNPNSISSQQREIVERAKRELYNRDSANSLVKVVRELPKDQWHKYIEPLEVLAQAIKELDREGKLIETLEDM
jgi:DNA-binding transcriptional regulator GbsR (MarR family)